MLPQATAQSGAALVYAEVTTPAPQQFTDPLVVFEPDWSTEFTVTFPGNTWPACHGNALPLPGAQALVAVDNRGNRSCIRWDGPMVFGTQTSQTYYLTNTASDVATYKFQTVTPYTPQTTISYGSAVTGVLQNFVTPTASPALSSIPAGQYEFHIHAEQTSGTQIVQLYAQFVESTSTGTDVGIIGTSQVSSGITTSITEYRLFFDNPNVYTLASTASRIVARLYAIVGGTGSAGITISVGGATDSHMVIPSPPPSGIQTGDIIPSFAASRAGCLLCDGNTYLVATYPALAAACPSLVSGGNITVPNIRGGVLVGADPTGTRMPVNAPALGTSGGAEQHTLLAAESGQPGNTFQVSDSGGFNGGIGAFNVAAGAIGLYQRAGGVANVQVVVPAANAASPHSIVQPYTACNWFIKT